MRKYEKIGFQLEFQLNENGKYRADVVISSNLSGEEFGSLFLGEFDTVKDVKQGFNEFKREFLAFYKTVGEQMLREGRLSYGSL